MSKTRQRFLERKKKRHEARKREAWEAAHTFWSQGTRSRRGNPNATCMFEVRFAKEFEGATAQCRMCSTVHIYGSPMTSMGTGRARWMTAAVYGESVIEPESIETIELEDGKEVRLVGHAQWCSDGSKALYGARGVWQGPGKIAWYMSGRRGVWHLCQSTLAAKYVRSYGKQ